MVLLFAAVLSADPFLSGLASVRARALAARDAARPASVTAACLRSPACLKPVVVSHRAMGFGHPENSRAGVSAAAAAGIEVVETDVRRTRDGVLVILHDETLDRTTDASGEVELLAWQEASRARLENGEPLPTLAELYARARGRSILLLDLKVDAVAEVAAWVERHGSFDDFIFFASDASTLLSCKTAASRRPGMIVMANVAEGLDLELIEQVWGGLPPLLHLSLRGSSATADLHRRGVKVYSALVGHDRFPGWRDAAAALLLDRGVDLIDTDDPLWLRRKVAGR